MKHTAEDILKLSRAEKNARKRMRLLALSQFLDCKNRTQVANQLNISRTSVNKWVTQYLESGLDGLEARKAKGRTPFLTAKQQKQLGDFIEAQSQNWPAEYHHALMGQNRLASPRGAAAAI